MKTCLMFGMALIATMLLSSVEGSERKCCEYECGETTVHLCVTSDFECTPVDDCRGPVAEYDVETCDECGGGNDGENPAILGVDGNSLLEKDSEPLTIGDDEDEHLCCYYKCKGYNSRMCMPPGKEDCTKLKDCKVKKSKTTVGCDDCLYFVEEEEEQDIELVIEQSEVSVGMVVEQEQEQEQESNNDSDDELWCCVWTCDDGTVIPSCVLSPEDCVPVEGCGTEVGLAKDDCDDPRATCLGQ